MWATGLEESSSPIFVFVNIKSGARQGEALHTKLTALLGPNQVIALAGGVPEKMSENNLFLLFIYILFLLFIFIFISLPMIANIPKLRILVAGGDGTVAWVLDAMDRINYPKPYPPVGILPLGTGLFV